MSVLFDEFHLSFFVSNQLPHAESRAISRTLNSKAFRARLAESIRAVVRRYPSLQRTRTRLSR